MMKSCARLINYLQIVILFLNVHKCRSFQCDISVTFRNSKTFELTETLHYLKTLIDIFLAIIFVSSKVGFILHGFSCVFEKKKDKEKKK